MTRQRSVLSYKRCPLLQRSFGPIGRAARHHLFRITCVTGAPLRLRPLTPRPPTAAAKVNLPSTTATTDDGGDTTACASPDARAFRAAATPGVERLSSKRAASSDPMSMSMIRSPKRRSQSRSPDLDPTATGKRKPKRKPQPRQRRPQQKATVRTKMRSTKSSNVAVDVLAKTACRTNRPLPSNAVFPQTREKRDAAQARKRERQLEKVAAPSLTRGKAPLRATPIDLLLPKFAAFASSRFDILLSALSHVGRVFH